MVILLPWLCFAGLCLSAFLAYRAWMRRLEGVEWTEDDAWWVER